MHQTILKKETRNKLEDKLIPQEYYGNIEKFVHACTKFLPCQKIDDQPFSLIECIANKKNSTSIRK